ncbi:hypothetical protein ABIE33_006028 [Ensifer sp. 4252]
MRPLFAITLVLARHPDLLGVACGGPPRCRSLRSTRLRGCRLRPAWMRWCYCHPARRRRNRQSEPLLAAGWCSTDMPTRAQRLHGHTRRPVPNWAIRPIIQNAARPPIV